MKDCFICFEPLVHGVSFGCKHEICLYCFMKLEANLCPYCRFPMHKFKMVHYSSYIPPFLNKICKTRDLFSYVLLQIYHTQLHLFHYKWLIRDINKWTIHPDVKKLFIHEIKVLYRYIHPDKKQILILLFHIFCVSFVTRNEVFLVNSSMYNNVNSYNSYIVMYPMFILASLIFLGYLIYYLYEYRKLYNFNYYARNKIKIENIITMSIE